MIKQRVPKTEADYENYVYSELNDDRKKNGKRINLHIKAPMKILDAGCGPGFFHVFYLRTETK